MHRWMLILALAAGGCANGAQPELPGGEPTPAGVLPGIHIGESVPVPQLHASVEFVDLLEDSRCPVDVTCIWEGNAQVQLRLDLPDGPLPFRLDTSPNAREHKGQVAFEYRGTEFSIETLLPAPLSSHRPEPGEYELILRIRS
jgi:hypothetical protein